jgi:Flp pilus assembly CpaF family ATPase
MVRMYMKKAYRTGHEGAIALFHRLQRETWIMGVKQLAEIIHHKCTDCAVD